MTKVMSATQVRANIFSLLDETAASHEPVLITGKRNNAVMISETDWRAIEETLYLHSQGIAEDLKNSMAEQDSEFSEQIEW